MQRRRPVKRYLALTAMLAIIAIMPMLIAFWASDVAAEHGCRLDEAGVHRCMVGGKDIGPELADRFMTGWLILFTWPILPAAIVPLVIAIRNFLRNVADANRRMR